MIRSISTNNVKQAANAIQNARTSNKKQRVAEASKKLRELEDKLNDEIEAKELARDLVSILRDIISAQ